MHMMTNIGKPYEGEPHVRFDEEGLAIPAFHSTDPCLRQLCTQKQERRQRLSCSFHYVLLRQPHEAQRTAICGWL